MIMCADSLSCLAQSQDPMRIACFSRVYFHKEPVLISDKESYCKILQSLQPSFEMFISFWKFAGNLPNLSY